MRLGSACGFSVMALMIKLANEAGVTLFQMMFWRQFFALPLVLGALYFTRKLFLLRTQRISGHLRRASLGLLGLGLNFAGFTLLPLAEATALGFTAPLFAVLATAIFLRERVGPWRWSAVLLGIAGVMIITQPGGHAIPLLGAGAALGSAVMMVVMNFVISDLTRTENPLTVTFYGAAFGSLFLSVTLPFTAFPQGWEQWLPLAGASLAGTCAQFLMVSSLRYGSISTVIVMDYSGLIWASLFGWIFWDSLPPLATWLGAPLIVAAGLIIVWREHRLLRIVTPASPMVGK